MTALEKVGFFLHANEVSSNARLVGATIAYIQSIYIHPYPVALSTIEISAGFQGYRCVLWEALDELEAAGLIERYSNVSAKVMIEGELREAGSAEDDELHWCWCLTHRVKLAEPINAGTF